MRQIIIDTETTGLDPKQGHRIIELAALEVIDRRVTGRAVHFRVDPEREIDAGATEVHGMTWEDLKGKPRFRDIVAEFAEFARGAEWIIHNAPFDIGFLDAELQLAEQGACADIYARLVDTLALAREMFPGKRNSLDALCERFGVDNAHRSVHGALLDAQLLADVYLAMTRGQETLTIDIARARCGRPTRRGDGTPAAVRAGARATITVVAPTPLELAAHNEYLAASRRRIPRPLRLACAGCDRGAQRTSRPSPRGHRRLRSSRPRSPASTASPMPIDYLQKILTAKVYDVAIESPLDLAPSLSARVGNRVLLKREDQQPVFSFKLRGAYNKMAQLSAAERGRGVIAASAGNHAQGVALAAQIARVRGDDRDAGDHAAYQDRGRRVARREGRAARRLVQRRLRACARRCRSARARCSSTPTTIPT